MKSYSLSFLAGVLLWSLSGLATDFSDGNLRKNDSKWFQFNFFTGFDNKLPYNNKKDTFFEMEFGGRTGVLDAYGFLDVFDALDTPQSDQHNKSNLFFKFEPRLSLDGIFQKDLSVGPVKEWYISNLFMVSDAGFSQELLGIGTDTEIPWLGKSVVNLMARYVRENFGAANEQRWDGGLLEIAWFKPLYTFEEKTFVTYQGYVNYFFGATMLADGVDRTDSSLEWYNGFYYHTQHYALGYGLKYYKDMALFKSGGAAGTTTGVGHYLVGTVKF